MKTINLISVGKLNNLQFKSLEQEYLKRYTDIDLKIHECRSQNGQIELESDEVIKKILKIAQGRHFILLFDQGGKAYDSLQFCKKIYSIMEGHQTKHIFFVLGGSKGVSRQLKEMAQEFVSLSTLTFPHKLARVILIEQLYRIQTIKSSHPYHVGH